MVRRGDREPGCVSILRFNTVWACCYLLCVRTLRCNFRVYIARYVSLGCGRINCCVKGLSLVSVERKCAPCLDYACRKTFMFMTT